MTFIAYVLAWLFVGCVPAMPQDSPPNVLFIAVDDLNTCAEGFNGFSSVPTPNINRLARKGIRFTNAHCAAPACNPSRVSVMTGLAPYHSGVYLNQQDWRKFEIFERRTTLPQHFRNHGYKTLGGGKIYHAASLREKQYEGYLDPRPWDEYFPSKKRQMPLEVEPAKVPMFGSGKYNGRFDWAALDIDNSQMADAKVVSWAEKQLSKTHEKPLFLAVGIYRPHIPWWTPKKYFDLHPLESIQLPKAPVDDLNDVPEAGQNMARRDWHKWMIENDQWKQAVQGYYASISFADDMVGRLLDAVESGPMSDNTIIVLWSDHGYHLGQKEHWEKFALWEQTTRVPLIFAAPQMEHAGVNCDQPVSLLDVFPTLSQLCDIPADFKLDGQNLEPLFENPRRQSARSVVITQDRGNHAVRSQRWRYIRYADGSEELYDQLQDSENIKNLAGQGDSRPIIENLKTWLPKFEAERKHLETKEKKAKSKKDEGSL